MGKDLLCWQGPVPAVPARTDAQAGVSMFRNSE